MRLVPSDCSTVDLRIPNTKDLIAAIMPRSIPFRKKISARKLSAKYVSEAAVREKDVCKSKTGRRWLSSSVLRAAQLGKHATPVHLNLDSRFITFQDLCSFRTILTILL